ncbi:hypothetical protein RHMOL_Rhmol08G0295800 [Rhododendron molle]|uniref:Uncharacterized protein n=1 Tax=Rhododendron molle TaxID=49168 RepID=A0ACC0MU31_RHOML|nr:hypothetical protein RHMOL_Rhmol08G0295800 [Rhododendron molle]
MISFSQGWAKHNNGISWLNPAQSRSPLAPPLPLAQFQFPDWDLPSALSNCSSLLHLSAEGNSLSGVVPSSIGALPHLQVISL